MTIFESPSFIPTGSITEELDRLEVLAGKIGMNSPASALELLSGLDLVHAQIDELDQQSPSRKVAETQFNMILSRLSAEGRQFLRDAGGVQAFRQAREQVMPTSDRTWWFVDERVESKRRSDLRRFLVIGGIGAVLLVVLAVLYQRFLAPDPKVSALYGAEQSARDRLQYGEFDEALSAVEEGLKIDPSEPTLLTLHGVILDVKGSEEQAAQDFARAEQAFASREIFLLTRGEGYAMVNQLDKAMDDAQEAAQINPQSPRAHLLIGQVHETQKSYQEAIAAYDRAYEAADQTNQLELAAIARARTAFLMQMIGMPSVETPTPAP